MRLGRGSACLGDAGGRLRFAAARDAAQSLWLATHNPALIYQTLVTIQLARAAP